MKLSLVMYVFLVFMLGFFILGFNGIYKLLYAYVENEPLKHVQSNDHILNEIKIL
jgi:hypothetical protein